MGLSKSKLKALILLIGVLYTACGYRFAGEGSLPGDTDRLFVKVLENRTQETGVENIVTAALLSELTLRKTDHLASGMDNADIVLSGEVEEVAIATIAARKKDTASERRVTVLVNLKLSQSDGSVVWKAKGFSDNQAYFVDDNNERTDANRRNAIRILSRRIAEKVVNRLSDDF
jgi:outer membrane lipopolysaccharide assembly protein LptE/RlpB